MKCKGCKRKVNKTDTFCPYCGRELKKQNIEEAEEKKTKDKVSMKKVNCKKYCKACGKFRNSKGSHCEVCGNELVWVCTKCGFVLEEQDEQCPQCGVKLVKKTKGKKILGVLAGVLLLIAVGAGGVYGVRYLLENREVNNDVDSDVKNEDQVYSDKEKSLDKEDEAGESSVFEETESETEESTVSKSLINENEYANKEKEDDVMESNGGDSLQENATGVQSSLASEIAVQETTAQDLLEEFVLNCDEKYFTKSDISGFDADMCRIARNSIYAHAGRKFQDRTLTDYFLKYDWYSPTIDPEDFSEDRLNDYQIFNKDLIIEYEKECGYR